jgi:hypothetical protein
MLSLGTYVILDHVAIAREAGLPYVYLGYWVPGSRKMGYKAKFSALEIYKGGIWHARLSTAGAVFEEAPRDEAYGRVAVWRDPFGNRWDLIGPRPSPAK